jgi:hypothetical protein
MGIIKGQSHEKYIYIVCSFPHSWHPVCQSSNTWLESCVPVRVYNSGNVCECSVPDSNRKCDWLTGHHWHPVCQLPTFLRFHRSDRIKVEPCVPIIVFSLFTCVVRGHVRVSCVGTQDSNVLRSGFQIGILCRAQVDKRRTCFLKRKWIFKISQELRGRSDKF